MNEFALIDRIRSQTKNDARVLVGIGDDTAVLRGEKKDILFTTDMLIEGRHFRTKEATPYQIGRKALAVNISDIAAMGGLPTHAVVAVGLPKKHTGRFARELYRGIRELARRFRVNVAGGDTNASDKLVISVALLGEVEKGKALLRSGARAGDAVFVTGPLGGSYVSKKHLEFLPKVAEARWLSKNARVGAMMDISDGLASDLHRLCGESKVGVCLEENFIPVSKYAKNVRQALTDGEDFELLFTVRSSDVKKIDKKFHQIGRIVPRSQGLTLRTKSGKRTALTGGFDHFR